MDPVTSKYYAHEVIVYIGNTGDVKIIYFTGFFTKN